MKILKWLVIFSVAFIVAWILIFTFTQPEFKVTAAAKILTYTTPKISVYLYVAGAFGTGLLLGLFTAFYYYVVLQRKVHQRTNELHDLEDKLAEARRALEQPELSRMMLPAEDERLPVESPQEDLDVLSDEDEPQEERL